MKLNRKQREAADAFEEITGFELTGFKGRKTFDEVLQYNFQWLRNHTEEAIAEVGAMAKECGP